MSSSKRVGRRAAALITTIALAAGVLLALAAPAGAGAGVDMDAAVAGRVVDSTFMAQSGLTVWVCDITQCDLGDPGNIGTDTTDALGNFEIVVPAAFIHHTLRVGVDSARFTPQAPFGVLSGQTTALPDIVLSAAPVGPIGPPGGPVDPPGGSTDYTVSGIITLPGDPDPVPYEGAFVGLCSFSEQFCTDADAPTDANGAYTATAEDVDSGNDTWFIVVFEDPAKYVAETEGPAFLLDADKTDADLTVTLGGVVSGSVLDGIEDPPVPMPSERFTVEADAEHCTGSGIEGAADDNGDFAIVLLPGEYLFCIPGYSPWGPVEAGPVTVVEGETVDGFDLVELPEATISGSIKDPATKAAYPGSKAGVVVCPDGNGVNLECDGQIVEPATPNFAIGELGAGSYAITPVVCPVHILVCNLSGPTTLKGAPVFADLDAGEHFVVPPIAMLTFRPDAKIMRGVVVRGSNVYETNPASPGALSTLTTTIPKTGATLSLVFENDGKFADKIVVKGPKTNALFTLTYKVGVTNITAAATSAAGYTTPSLSRQNTGATSTKTVTVTIVPKALSKKGSKLTGVFTAQSKSLATKKDGVKAVVTRL